MTSEVYYDLDPNFQWVNVQPGDVVVCHEPSGYAARLFRKTIGPGQRVLIIGIERRTTANGLCHAYITLLNAEGRIVQVRKAGQLKQRHDLEVRYRQC